MGVKLSTDDLEIAESYSDISADYDGWYSAEWPQPIYNQGSALAEILKNLGVPDHGSIYDVTCGIGTQCIGLSLLGYRLTGLDISSGQIKRAREEEKKYNTGSAITWIEGDAKNPSCYVTNAFDAVISCGNSLPLLGSKDAVKNAIKQIYNVLIPNGSILISMRDHSDLRAKKPYLIGSGKLNRNGKKGVWVETGLWQEDGERYVSNIIFVWTEPVLHQMHYPFPPLAALTKDEFIEILGQSGFKNIKFYNESETRFAYPFYTATK